MTAARARATATSTSSSRRPPSSTARARTARTPSSSSQPATRPASSRRSWASRAGKNIDIADCTLIARVGVGPVEGGFGLDVKLELIAPSLGAEDAAAFMKRAHGRCPYSRAITGNVPLELVANGVTIEL